MDQRRDETPPGVSRVLVAADPGVDPHRLVTLCCRQPDSELLSVSLLVPLDAGPEASSHGCIVRTGLLRTASRLLDAAGVRLEDFVLVDENVDALEELVGSGEFEAILVCAGNGGSSSPVLPLLAQLGRLYGVAVVDGGSNLRGHKSWLRRVVDPLLRW